MTAAVYAGSFDPITNGHLAILRAALPLAERLVVAVGVHDSKKPLFTFAERKKLIAEAVQSALGQAGKKVEIIAFDGLLAEKARELKARLLIRGLRSGADFDYEMQMAGMNKALAPELQTVFLPAAVENRALSGSLVRQIATLGGDVSAFVPANVARALAKKYAKA